MPLTEFQRTVCRLIAANRITQGESYVAGGAALNLLAGGKRFFRDRDLFHDTEEALNATWTADRKLLESNQSEVRVHRERPGFVEATVGQGGGEVLLQWARDSAFRFFPLMEHEDFGLTLHPFDLATNKVLALVGRSEVRDWIDVMTCHDHIQPLGYLAWAACGKDPGFSPAMILEQASRANRHSSAELAALSFEGERPDATALSRKWHLMLDESHEIIAALPPEESGKCVLDHKGFLFTENEAKLRIALVEKAALFHEGSIRGAYPRIVA